MKFFKYDDINLSRLDSAEAVLRDLSARFDDYNHMHPHKGLKMRSPSTTE
ncbi:hypothetical protein KRR26_34490 [Corallococcus sp. M34]|nr:hypothetical protein [Citreicoccus inhibens]